MPRPIKKRTAKSYRRDVEALGRLRTAIQVDLDIDRDLQTNAITEIDTLITTLAAIIRNTEQQPTT